MPVSSDWPSNVAVTGYWVLEEAAEWAPDPQLASFIHAGEPPIYVGFGSMPGIEPQELTALVIEALVKSGKRGVLATGGGAMQNIPNSATAHFIQSAPHEKLFPLMKACAHHGGAGTTGASLRAGKPTIICPFFGDQPFWATRVEDLGVGTKALERRKLSSDFLASAIVEATSNPSMTLRASELGSLLRSENGVSNAISALDRMVLLTPRRP